MGSGQAAPTPLLEEMSLEKAGRIALCVEMLFFFNLLHQDSLTPLPPTLGSLPPGTLQASVSTLSVLPGSATHGL